MTYKTLSSYSLGRYFLKFLSLFCAVAKELEYVYPSQERRGLSKKWWDIQCPWLSVYLEKLWENSDSSTRSPLLNAKSAWRIPATVSKTATNQLQIIQTKSSGWVQGMLLHIHAPLSKGWEGRRNMPCLVSALQKTEKAFQARNTCCPNETYGRNAGFWH